MSNLHHFNAVYTQDKHKKQNKKWLDGSVRYNPSENILLLYDESDVKIASYNLKTSDVVENGEELDLGRFQVVINEVISIPNESLQGDNDDNDKQDLPTIGGYGMIPMKQKPIPRKRKFPRLLHVCSFISYIDIDNGKQRAKLV